MSAKTYRSTVRRPFGSGSIARLLRPIVVILWPWFACRWRRGSNHRIPGHHSNHVHGWRCPHGVLILVVVKLLIILIVVLVILIVVVVVVFVVVSILIVLKKQRVIVQVEDVWVVEAENVGGREAGIDAVETEDFIDLGVRNGVCIAGIQQDLCRILYLKNIKKVKTKNEPNRAIKV